MYRVNYCLRIFSCIRAYISSRFSYSQHNRKDDDVFSSYNGAQDSQNLLQHLFQNVPKLCSFFKLWRLLMNRDTELQLYDALLFTGGSKRGSLLKWFARLDEEVSSFSRQSLWGISVWLLGFLAKSKPWKLSSFASAVDKSQFHPDPQKPRTDHRCLNLFLSTLLFSC